MTETEKRVREYLAKIGRRGGLASRRDLTRSHAKQMVAIREAKRAALKGENPGRLVIADHSSFLKNASQVRIVSGLR
jgi:hypothetical protein